MTDDRMIGRKIVQRTWGVLSNKRKQKRREQREWRDSMCTACGQRMGRRHNCNAY
jgi:hypothetical protein